MKAEEVSLIAGIGGVSGYAVKKAGIGTGNELIDAIIGAGLAGLGWFMDMDGVGDFVEGFGVGYFAGALI